MHRSLAVLAVLFSVTLAAQQPPTLIVQGGRIFDSERQEARALGQLWIRDHVIEAEHPADTKIPDGVAVLDASGRTLLPGLFDMHAHVASHGGTYTLKSDPVENLETALLCGVVNVVDLHGDPAAIFALRERSRTDARLARLWCAGAAFTAPKGHATQFGFPANEVASTDDVAQRFTALLPHKPDVIKLIVEHGGWGGLPDMPALDEPLARAVVTAAHAAGRRAFSHVWSLAEAKTAVSAGVDALCHGVFLGKVDDELATAMVEARTAYIPTLSVVLATGRAMKKARPYDHALVREVLHPELCTYLNDDDLGSTLMTSPMARMGRNLEPTFLSNLKVLFDRGVPVGLGTDAGNPLVPHGPAVLLELELYVAAGLTPGQALHAATLGSATILGVADRHGSLAPGKEADLVLVEGDPVARIADVWNVTDVVRSGKRIDRAPARARNAERSKPAEVLTVTPYAPAPAFPFGGVFELSADRVAGGNSRGEIIASKERVLHVRGEIKAGFAWGPWAGASMLWHPERRRLVDARACTGVRLHLRGTKRALTVTLHCAAVRDFNVFTATVQPDDTLRTVEVPFSAFKQIGFGKKVTWTGTDITGMALEFRCAPMTKPVEGEVELEVAAIGFY